MGRLQLILRSLNVTTKQIVIVAPCLSHRFYSSKKDDSDSEKTAEKLKKPTAKKNEDSINKLNILLQEMVHEDTSKAKLNLARPKRQRAVKPEPGQKSVKSETVEQKIISAVKNVAEVIEGDKKQIESELLSKLLNGSSEPPAPSASLSDIVKGMKIDRETKAPEVQSRAQQVRQILDARKPDTQADHRHKESKPSRRTFNADDSENIVYSAPVDILGAEPLGIFTTPLDDVEPTVNETWRKLQERELRLAVTHPPTNYFQEMILWTEQGKIWKFPIDNEYGMEEEQNIYFAEHVFTEKYLEPWCPNKGPVRHFMELVCVGLSKNPYMSVKDKREHIEWYKNYFEDKMQLLKEVGAIPADYKPTKQIEAE